MVAEVRDILMTGRGLALELQPDDLVMTPTFASVGTWEEDVAKAIEQFMRPGWTLLDVGANVGWFTLVAAQRGHDVIAIEADPGACEILERNVERNGFTDRVRVIRAAVSDQAIPAFMVDGDEPGNPGERHLSFHGDASAAVDTTLLTDLLGETRPEFIKIDIEGLEARVLAAAPEILEAAQVVVFEAGGHATRYGSDPQDVIDLLEGSGFVVTYMNGAELPRDWAAPLDELPDAYINLLARRNPEPVQLATILLCAWRGMTVETAQCMFQLREHGWGYQIVHGDALIARSRSRAVSNWYRNTDDDVFLMIDDDVVFTPEHAESVVRIARERRSIAVGAYVVKDGSHLACRRFVGQNITFGPYQEPVEIEYPATGFMAVHRDVIDALVAAKKRDMPEWRESAALVDADTAGGYGGTDLVEALRRRIDEPAIPLVDEFGQQPFYPLFDTFSVTWNAGEEHERHEYLSEDYAFGEMARRLGFKVWLDPSVILYHLGTFPYNVHQMKDVQRLDPRAVQQRASEV